MKVEMEKMYGSLCSMSGRLEDLKIRGQTIIRRTDKGEKIFDMAFDGDFSHLRTGLRSLANRANDYYHFCERAMKVIKVSPNLEHAGNMARSLMLICRHFRLEMEKLLAISNVARTVFRKMPVTVYWWELDKTIDELYKTSALILEFGKQMVDLTREQTPS